MSLKNIISKKLIILNFVFFISIFFVNLAKAHVPYIEKEDYSEEKPFEIKDSVENSKAIYAYFENTTDLDVYSFEIKKPVRLYVQAIVPLCKQYKLVLPWIAVAGPGLPLPSPEIPFALPDGYGALIVKNNSPDVPRKTFYEQFSFKYYYDGPEFDSEISVPGKWYLYFWNPYKVKGDYTAVIGFKEVFSFSDFFLTLVNTPKVWFNFDLHIKCIK